MKIYTIVFILLIVLSIPAGALYYYFYVYTDKGISFIDKLFEEEFKICDAGYYLPGGLQGMMCLQCEYDTEAGATECISCHHYIVEKRKDHNSTVNAISYSKYGNDGLGRLVSGDANGNIIALNLQTEQETEYTYHGEYSADNSSINALAFCPYINRLASGSEDGTLRIWDADDTYTVNQTLTNHTDAINALLYFPDDISGFSKILISGSSDKTIIIWNADNDDNYSVTQTLTGHADAVNALALSLDGTSLASGDASGNIKIWNMNGYGLLQTLSADTGTTIYSLMYLSDEVVVAGDDIGLKFWDTTDYSVVENEYGAVFSLSLSPNGNVFAAGSTGGAVSIYNTTPNLGASVDSFIYQIIKSYSDNGAADVQALSYSEDGNALASGDTAQYVNHWWTTC